MIKYDIYGIGAALVDTEIAVSDQNLRDFGVDKGIMTLVDEPRQQQLLDLLSEHMTSSKLASGGSAANSVIAASYFGASTFYSCRVADDELGKFYLNDLAAARVDVHASNGSAQGMTGKCLVMITPDAERTMNTFLGISENLSVDDIDIAAVQQSALVYIEGYQVTSATGKPAAIWLKQTADLHNVKTAVSLSDPAIVEHFHSGLQEIIGDGVDILFCNEQEALNFTKSQSLETAAEALKSCARTFAITLGSKGALIFDGEKQFNVDAHRVKAVDSNGAGDMFAGAFLYGISQGQSYQTAATLAVKAAAQVVSQFGPRLKAEQHAELLNATGFHAEE
ncbi:MAG: sugar/nucleoside kinase (ribokinase family) [Lentisphaeria bacterium]|jgi:sugar/nucleoside kinase (ribokinase family)